MVQAVDMRSIAGKNFHQLTLRVYFYRMSQVIPGLVMTIMLDIGWKLLGQVLVQAATQGNVDYLAATANTQEWLLNLDH